MKEKIYLIPGLMTDHRLWSRIIPLLENDYELVHTPIPHSEDFDEIIDILFNEFKEEKIGKKVERIIFLIKSYEAKIDLDQFKGKNIKFKLKVEDEEETLLFIKDIIKNDSGYEIKLVNLDNGGTINMNAPKTEEELYNWFKKIAVTI